MAAGRWNILLEVGASWSRTATFRRASDSSLVNFTGATAKGVIRSSDASDAVELLELSTTNGRLVLGGALGTVRVVLDEEATILLEGYDSAVWDVFVRFDADTVWKVWKGAVRIDARRTTGV